MFVSWLLCSFLVLRLILCGIVLVVVKVRCVVWQLGFFIVIGLLFLSNIWVYRWMVCCVLWVMIICFVLQCRLCVLCRQVVISLCRCVLLVGLLQFRQFVGGLCQKCVCSCVQVLKGNRLKVGMLMWNVCGVFFGGGVRVVGLCGVGVFGVMVGVLFGIFCNLVMQVLLFVCLLIQFLVCNCLQVCIMVLCEIFRVWVSLWLVGICVWLLRWLLRICLCSVVQSWWVRFWVGLRWMLVVLKGSMVVMVVLEGRKCQCGLDLWN